MSALELLQTLVVAHHSMLGVLSNSGVADFTCTVPEATNAAGKLKVWLAVTLTIFQPVRSPEADNVTISPTLSRPVIVTVAAPHVWPAVGVALGVGVGVDVGVAVTVAVAVGRGVTVELPDGGAEMEYVWQSDLSTGVSSPGVVSVYTACAPAA